MAQKKIYEYAVVFNPNKDDEKDGYGAEIIVDVQRVLADNEATVNIIASRQIPEHYLDRLDRVEIAVRPF